MKTAAVFLLVLLPLAHCYCVRTRVQFFCTDGLPANGVKVIMKDIDGLSFSVMDVSYTDVYGLAKLRGCAEDPRTRPDVIVSARGGSCGRTARWDSVLYTDRPEEIRKHLGKYYLTTPKPRTFRG